MTAVARYGMPASVPAPEAAPAPALGRVLIVDDDRLTQSLLARTVAEEGFDCEIASTAAEARALVAACSPDLVLLDVHLPGESGLSLVRDLAADPTGPAVVMVSGCADPEVAAIALENGAYGYVTKPFKPHEVAIAAHDALRRQRREREGRASRTRLEDRVVERGAAAEDALQRLRHSHEETVLRLSKAIEYRDPESGPHIDRMSGYCGLLAARFGLDADVVRVASRLHDVGKIAVPDAILLKPGPLTPDEREGMERHAETGYRLLRGSGIELLETAATIAWTHHERYDGGGYPRGLAGEGIPLVGRIAAIADVFDALMTNRAYRPARSVEEAVATVAGERGRHFDPAVVDAFMDSIADVEGIIGRFEEPAPRPVAETGPAEPTLVTLQQAAAAVGVSASTLRRWADEGRIQAVRTAGGHRRFPLEAVRRLTTERGRGVAVKPVQPPADGLKRLAVLLQARGADLAATAKAALYRGGSAGWFAGPEVAPLVEEWISGLARACGNGRYDGALEATEAIMRRASLQGAPLLERHRFLERFGDVAVRALSQADATQDDLASARRLFAALQQAQLADRS
jgi:putative two-component system response regulator